MHVHQQSPSKVVHQKLSIPLKKKRREKDKSEWAYNLTRAKKKDKGERWRSQGQTPRKRHSSLTHTCTWPSSKGDMISQRQDLWSCKINEKDMQVYPYFEPHKSLLNVGEVFSKDLSEVQTQNERLRVSWKRWEHTSCFENLAKTSKYREKEVNHVLHRVVLGINIRRWRC